METIKLEKGWLIRQMKEFRQEVQQWPEVLMPLTHLNSAIVQQNEVTADESQVPTVEPLNSNTSESE